jgi:hypothetical protein
VRQTGIFALGPPLACVPDIRFTLKISLRCRRFGALKITVFGLLFLVSGCAGGDSGNNRDNDKNSGFYSGVSGGWSRP